jgi:hypothetical protein
MSKRWKRRILWGILMVFLVAIGSYIYLFPAGGLEGIVNKTVNDLLPEELGIDVRIGELRGNIISGVILENVSVWYADSIGATELAHASRVVAAYSFSNLWHRDYRFELVEIDSLRLTVNADSAGAYRLPALRGGGEKDEGSAGAEFAIAQLAIRDAELAVITNHDTAVVHDFNLVASLEADGGMLSSNVQQLRLRYPRGHVDLTAATGKVAYASHRLLFQDLLIVSEGTRARLNGTYFPGTKEGKIEFAVDGFNAGRLQEWGLPKLRGLLDLTGNIRLAGSTFDGSVNIGGNFMIASLENLQTEFRFADKVLTLDTLYGTVLNGCSVDGFAEIDFGNSLEQYSLIASVRNFNLANLIEGSFQSDLNGTVALRGESFQNATMRLEVNTELFESRFDEYPLQRAHGLMVITTEDIAFPEPFTVDYFENTFTTTGKVAYKGNMRLSVDAELRNLDRYRGKLFIDQPGGRARAHAVISGKTSDPDLRGTFVSDSLWLYELYADSCFASTSIERFLTGRQGSVVADFIFGAAWGTTYDSAAVRLGLDSTVVLIDSATITGSLMSATGNGRFDYGAEPSTLLLDSLMLRLVDQLFYNQGQIDIAMDSTGFLFNRAAIARSGSTGGRIQISGTMNYDETMRLRLAVDSVLAGPWVELFQYDVDLDGYVSCLANATGSLVYPSFSLTGTVDSLTYRGLKLGDLMVSAEYGGRILRIDSLVVLSDSGRYYGSGYLNADLALVHDSLDRLPDLPLDIEFSAEDTEFDLVSLLLPSVEQLTGKFWADFRLFGTPSDPHLEGEMYLRDARLKYFDLVQYIYTDSASVTMEDNRIVINRLEAYVRDERKDRRSYAYIEGDLVLKSIENFVYDLDISIPREFPFTYELDDIDGSFEGELQVRGETPPTIFGDIDVISARYRVPFAEPDEGSPILSAYSAEDGWNLDINIDIISNYWIENDDVDAEFSGEINLIRERGQYRFVGEMDILRGRAFLFDKTFRLEDNSTITFEDIEYFNPRLDVYATTYITGSRIDVESTPERLELQLHITGPLDSMEIDVVPGSGFTREDLPALLALNYYTGETFQANSRIEERISQYVGAQMSQIGSRQLSQLGVETFEIDPTYGGEFDPLKSRLTIGLYVPQLPGFYVYGRSTISGTGEEVGFEYRISRSMLMEGRRSDQDDYILNMKLHWEF